MILIIIVMIMIIIHNNDNNMNDMHNNNNSHDNNNVDNDNNIYIYIYMYYHSILYHSIVYHIILKSRMLFQTPGLRILACALFPRALLDLPWRSWKWDSRPSNQTYTYLDMGFETLKLNYCELTSANLPYLPARKVLLNVATRLTSTCLLYDPEAYYSENP